MVGREPYGQISEKMGDRGTKIRYNKHEPFLLL